MPPLFDTHFHVLDHRSPLTENQGLAPPLFDDAVSFYRPRVAPARDGDKQPSEEHPK